MGVANAASICRHSLSFTTTPFKRIFEIDQTTPILLHHPPTNQPTMSTTTNEITEKQAIHAHKVAQKVADYQSRRAANALKYTDNPSANIGVFSKLPPELRNKIFTHLFEDVFQPAPDDTPCPCRLVPGSCSHVAHEIYKPLSHLRPFLAVAATCKLFRSETHALLFVDYVPRTPWAARGKQGYTDLKKFLRNVRPQDQATMDLAWRVDNVDIDSTPVGERVGKGPVPILGVSDLFAHAIDRAERGGTAVVAVHFTKMTVRARTEWDEPQAWDTETGRFYFGHVIDPPFNRESVVVRGPLKVVFGNVRQGDQWDEESKLRYEAIVRM